DRRGRGEDGRGRPAVPGGADGDDVNLHRPALVAVIATGLAVLMAAPASAAPGQLDPTFNGTGHTLVQVSAQAQDEPQAVALTKAGGVVVVGGVVANDGGED